MAPSPIIPTSFVPKQPVRSSGRFSKSGGNIILLSSIGILFISLFAAAAVFGYSEYLKGVRDAKRSAVENAEQSIDTASVEEFIRTRDRFNAAQGLLDGHVASSRFFELLERVTLATVRFNSLSLSLAEDRSASIIMDGVATTFNSLAAQSSALAEEREVKRAIFSEIDVNEDTDTVSFSLSAVLAPSLLSFVAPQASMPVTMPAVEEEGFLLPQEAPMPPVEEVLPTEELTPPSL